MKVVFVVASMLALAAVPVSAESNESPAGDQANSSQSAPEVASPDKKPAEKKVCKTIAETGTRTGKRVCMTKEQWRKAERDM